MKQRFVQWEKIVNGYSDNNEILLNQVSTWYQTYVLKLPIDGKITFTKYWSANQDIKVEIIFPYGLVTTYRRELPFGQQMEGSAEIITDNLRLAESFSNPINSLWEKIGE